MPTLSDVFALPGAVRGDLVLTPEAEKNYSPEDAENLEVKGLCHS
jgi:ribosome biogenesis protein Tsr3